MCTDDELEILHVLGELLGMEVVRSMGMMGISDQLRRPVELGNTVYTRWLDVSELDSRMRLA